MKNLTYTVFDLFIWKISKFRNFTTLFFCCQTYSRALKIICSIGPVLGIVSKTWKWCLWSSEWAMFPVGPCIWTLGAQLVMCLGKLRNIYQVQPCWGKNVSGVGFGVYSSTYFLFARLPVRGWECDWPSSCSSHHVLPACYRAVPPPSPWMNFPVWNPQSVQPLSSLSCFWLW